MRGQFPSRIEAVEPKATVTGFGCKIRYRQPTAQLVLGDRPEPTCEPAHLECFVGEISLDYNDGPHDPAGPDKPTWAPFEGPYRIYQWGKPADTVTVRRRNGWLYLNDIRLVVELEPGLFFTSDGEAVDFRHAPPTWRNLSLQRAS